MTAAASRPRTDHRSYDRDGHMGIRVNAAAIAALTVLATVWQSLGTLGQTIVLVAAVVVAIGTLWSKLVRPIVHTVTEASQAYKTLTGVDAKIDGFLAQMTDFRERLEAVEAAIKWIRKRVGTRDDDHPDRQS